MFKFSTKLNFTCFEMRPELLFCPVARCDDEQGAGTQQPLHAAAVPNTFLLRIVWIEANRVVRPFIVTNVVLSSQTAAGERVFQNVSLL